MPKYQVSRFQAIAPPKAAKITRSSITSIATMPEPIVPATCRPNTRKATKLKKAAQYTAQRGASTRVETMVAMELAASCNPFKKSNNSAVPTSTIRRTVTATGARRRWR